MSDLDQKVKDIVAHAYANAKAFQTRMLEAELAPSDVESVTDLRKLSVFSKDQLIQLQQENPPLGGMLAVPMSEIDHLYFSPGPVYEPGALPDDDSWEVAKQLLEMAGFNSDDIVLNSLSYHLVPAGLLVDQGLVRMGCVVVPGGIGNSELQLKMMKDLGCTAYAGTPSFLMSLIKKAEEIGLDFKNDFKVTKALVSAEPLPPSLRAEIEGYGIRVANAYGTAELGIFAVDCGDGPPLAMKLFDEPIVELLDPETGESVPAGTPGEVVVTNFNRAYPLIRFGTGDMALNLDPAPGKSKQSDRMITLVGRSGEASKVRGMFVHPNQIRFASSQVAGVLAVQGVVSRPELRDQFSLRVELADGVDETAVTEQLKQAIKMVCRVGVDQVETVPTGTLTAESPGMVDERDWQK
ncbi:MAG: AMP-binding protein [Chloroflexota bacterium]